MSSALATMSSRGGSAPTTTDHLRVDVERRLQRRHQRRDVLLAQLGDDVDVLRGSRYAVEGAGE